MFRDFRGDRPIDERIRNLKRNIAKGAAKKKFTQGGSDDPSINAPDPPKKPKKNQ